MTFSAIVFTVGATMMAFGLLGEGVTIKDISIPKTGKVTRFSLMALGSIFITLGLGFGAAEMFSETSAIKIEPSTQPILDPEPEPQPEPLPGDDGFIAEVERQLVYASGVYSSDGYLLVDHYVSILEDNQAESITLTLEAGVPSVIAGVCDSDCGDIDLWLYDENNNLIDFDEEVDDYPFVVVTPEWTGEYVLEAGIPNCSADYCYYGIGLLQLQSDATEIRF